MATAKKLNEASLNKGFNKFNEKVLERVTDRFSETYEIEVVKYLKKTDTQKIMIDYMSIIDELKDMQGVDNLRDSIIIPMLLIKYFTNISVPDEGEKLLSMADKLVELELFDVIMNLLPEKELLKMTEVADQFNESVKKMVSEKESKEVVEDIKE